MRYYGLYTLILSFIFPGSPAALDIDGLLRYRQVSVPLSTGAAPSAAASSSLSPSASASQSGATSDPSLASTDTAASFFGAASTSFSPDQPQSTSFIISSETQSSFFVSSVPTSSGDSSIESKISISPHSSKTEAVVTTIISVSGSSTFSNVVTSSQVLDAASASATSSTAPGLSGSTSTGSSSGLSSSSKKIIGGVVGGVGGAILLGALAVVAFRIWGKKTKTEYRDDDLMDPQVGREKTSSVSGGQTPFITNLEQHHAGPINTSSNF